jgi:ribosome-associated protein
MRHTPHKQNTPDAEEDTGPSKTQRKEAMHALQEIGKQLIELPDERLKKVPLSESLRDAVLAARKITAHEARRRQLQYVGRLMRDVDAAPIAAALAAFEKTSDEEKARQHRLEKLREDLLADEKVLTSLAQEHPHANLQLLRQLRRNTLKEREAGKPPAAYRQLFKELKSLQAESTTMPPAESSDE